MQDVTKTKGGRERREYARRPFEKAAFCYHNGARLEGRPMDISIGGMLLLTAEPLKFKRNDVLGVVFDRSAGFDPPVYLFGRVARHQGGAQPGIGLRWERAVTSGTPDDLVSVLHHLFGVGEEILRPQVAPGAGRMKTMFSFEKLLGEARRKVQGVRPEAAAASPVMSPAPPVSVPNTGPIGIATSVAEVDSLRVKVVSHEQGMRLGDNTNDEVLDTDLDALELQARPARPSPEADRARRSNLKTKLDTAARGDEASTGLSLAREHPSAIPDATPPGGTLRRQKGTITAEVARQGMRVIAGFEGILEVGELNLAVRVVNLGPEALFVATPVAPIDEGDLIVRLPIPTRDGRVPVMLSCTLLEARKRTETDPAGLELRINGVDEGRIEGIFVRYVKWLHFNSMAGE